MAVLSAAGVDFDFEVPVVVVGAGGLGLAAVGILKALGHARIVVVDVSDEKREAAMQAGRDTLFDVDWQGGQQIRASALGGHVVSIFVLPPSLPELERRLRSRGQDSDAVIAGRMEKSRAEISHWAEYDYVLVNDDLDETEQRLRAILTAERLRRERQGGLGRFVKNLMEENA